MKFSITLLLLAFMLNSLSSLKINIQRRELNDPILLSLSRHLSSLTQSFLPQRTLIHTTNLSERTDTPLTTNSELSIHPNTTVSHFQSLTNYANVQYYSTVELGSQKKQLTLIFDTGSSLMWVPSVSCGGRCHSKRNFNPSSSSTYKQLSSTPTQITYGKGSAQGYLSEDTLELQHATLTNYEFLSVFQDSELEGAQADGIIGIAPVSGESYLLKKLKEQKSIDKMILSVLLTNSTSGSSLQFGGWDDSLFLGDLTWIPLRRSDRFYTVSLISGSLGNFDFALTGDAIFDTGTSYLGVPSYGFSVFDNYLNEKVSGSCEMSEDLFKCDCSGKSLSDFDSLILQIGEGSGSSTSYTIVLPPQAYIALVSSVNYRAMIPVFQKQQTPWISGSQETLSYKDITLSMTCKSGKQELHCKTSIKPRVKEQRANFDSKSLLIVLAAIIGSAILIMLIIYLCRSNPKDISAPPSTRENLIKVNSTYREMQDVGGASKSGVLP